MTCRKLAKALLFTLGIMCFCITRILKINSKWVSEWKGRDLSSIARVHNGGGGGTSDSSSAVVVVRYLKMTGTSTSNHCSSRVRNRKRSKS